MRGAAARSRRCVRLNKVGTEGVERLNALGIIPDLSHVSDVTSLDAARQQTSGDSVARRGAGARQQRAVRVGRGDQRRREVGRRGRHLQRWSFWLTTDPAPTAASYIKQIRHIVNVGGIDAVGIANDYPIGGEQAAIKVGNDNAQAIKGYLAWWDRCARRACSASTPSPRTW